MAVFCSTSFVSTLESERKTDSVVDIVVAGAVGIAVMGDSEDDIVVVVAGAFVSTSVGGSVVDIVIDEEADGTCVVGD